MYPYFRTGLALLGLGLFLQLGVAGGVLADTVDYRGTFAGASGHQTGGTFTIVNTGNGHEVVLSSDFTFDGAPDPWVALGNASVKEAGFLAVLQQNSGRQSYKIPQGIDPMYITHLYIWCKKYAVPLGVAKLEKQ